MLNTPSVMISRLPVTGSFSFDFRAGKTASVDDAAVVKLIAVNGIAFADKAGDYAGICGNAAVENERCLYILEFCEFFL